MPASIGVNLRVTGHCSQGGRKYMEDFFSVAYQQSLSDERDLEYAFIGIYDGHGGSEAATFAKEHLINLIVNQKLFWSNDDRDVLRAIREGYIATHYAMWREQEKWPKTATGLPSTAGTTASVAFIRHGKIYIGHVGDSGIVLGYQEDGEKNWRARPLTQDHKPECNVEKARIINSGGKVVTKSGVPRVVWNRPRLGHKGPVRRSTPIDEIPFLAVARSLGDLWSYNSALNEFVVSPEPDVRVVKIDPKRFRCLIFGTDGLWNVLSAQTAVDNVRLSELMNERNVCLGGSTKDWTNPSKNLVDRALERWSNRKMRADNTSVVIIMLDPPGPPKRDVLKTCSSQQYSLDYMSHVDTDDEHTDALRTETRIGGDGSGDNFTMFDHRTNEHIDLEDMPMPTSGLAIMTRAYDPSVVNDFVSVDKHQTYHMHHVTGVGSSSMAANAEVPYMNSFAESYNSLLNSSLEHDQSYIYNSGESEDVVADVEDEDYDEDSGDGSSHFASVQQQAMAIDTYRLTKLQTRSEQQINSINTADLLFQQPTAIDAYRLHHPSHHYQTLSSTSFGIPCATTSNFRLATAASVEQTLPAVESILHDLHNSTNYYAANQKVLIDPNDITIISNCSEPDEPQGAVAVAVAVECLAESNFTFQPDYEPEIEEEMSTVDLTISPATIEDLTALNICPTIAIHRCDDDSQTIAIHSRGDSHSVSSTSEAMDVERIIDDNEPQPSQTLSPSPVLASPPPPKIAPSTSAAAAATVVAEVPIERIMTRSSQAQPAAITSPRITRSTDKRAITKQSEKKRRQVALKAKIDAIIQKRGTTNASTATGDNPANNKFHKENISNVRKLRKNVAVTELASVANTRTRNASIRIPSPATISTSIVASNQRTLRSQNTVTKDKAPQASTSRTDHLPNETPSASPSTTTTTNAPSKQNFSNKANSSAINKQLNVNNNNNNNGRSNGNCSSSSNSVNCSSSSSSSKQPKRLTDTVQMVKNDATKLKTNVQQFLTTTRQLRDAKLVALNNVSTIRCKMMLPSRCSNSSSFLGDVERTMITRRTRLHH